MIPETGWMIAAVLGPATGAACRATTSGTDGDLDAAMAQETVFGLAKMESGETAEGAARFPAGEGRHGTFR